MSDTSKRPGAVMAAAVMLFIFGGYTILGSLCGVGVIGMVADTPAAAPGGEVKVDLNDQLAQQRALAAELPGYVPTMIAFTVVSLLLGVVKIVAALGVLRLNPSARKAAIVAALCSMVLDLSHTGYSWVFEQPINNRFFDAQAKLMQEQIGGRPPFDIGGLMKGLTSGVIIFAVVFNIVIWVIVISLLNTQKVRDAFAGKFPEPEPAPVDERIKRYDGYEDDADAVPAPLPKSPGDTGITDRPA